MCISAKLSVTSRGRRRREAASALQSNNALQHTFAKRSALKTTLLSVETPVLELLTIDKLSMHVLFDMDNATSCCATLAVSS